VDDCDIFAQKADFPPGRDHRNLADRAELEIVDHILLGESFS